MQHRGMTSRGSQIEQLAEELHSALSPIISNRTKNPLVFLCSHFRDKVGYANNPVASAYARLRLGSTRGQYCETNIMLAYQKLTGDTDHVPSDRFLQLLTLLVNSLPVQLATKLLQVYSVLARLPPNFATFFAAVKVCMLLEELALVGHQLSGNSPQLAEVRRLLTQLFQQKQWLLHLEPMEPFQRLRAVHLPQLPGSKEMLLDEEVAQQVEEIVGMMPMEA